MTTTNCDCDCNSNCSTVVSELVDNMRSVQKALAGLYEQIQDSKMKQEEYNRELKRRIWELQWCSRERRN
jgi:hypothetical protein